MKTIAKNLMVILTALLMLTGFAMGVEIVNQGFETDQSGYSHTPSQTPATDPGDQYFYRAEPSDASIYEGSVGPYTNVTGSWLFVGSNPNTINASSPGVLTLDVIDVSTYTDLEFSADFGACPADWDAADELKVEYSWNNSDWSTLYYFVSAGTNLPLDLAGNATGGNNTANGTTLTYALTSIVSDNFTGTGTNLYIRIVCDAGSNYEAFGVDNIVLTGTAAGGVENPSVTGGTVGTTSNALNWDLNGNSDDVLLAYKMTDDIGSPTDGKIYSVSDTIKNAGTGATVLYVGSNTTYTHTPLTPNTTYYYKLFSVDGSTNYSSGISGTLTTLKEAPTNHVSTFAGSATYNSITLTWADNNGASVADGFIIKGSDVSLESITAPSDGDKPAVDTDWSNGDAILFASPGDETIELTSLDASTTYYFKIYPYTNDDSNIDYKTDGTVPEVTQATPAAPVTVPPIAGDVVITELCDDGSGGYQSAFMEIYNNTSSLIDMEDAYIKRIAADGSDDGYSYTFGVDVTIPANGFLIVARGQVEATFESDWSVDLSANNAHYDAGHSDLYFTTGRSYKLYTSGNALIDTTIAVNSNLRSIQSNDVWSATESDVNGTPAALDGGQVTEVPLPITLASFTATAVNGTVELAWETASETNNARFVIYRNDAAIASVEGAGTTSKPSSYSYVDAEVVPGVAYTYVLADVDYANTETKYEDDAVTVTLGNDVMEADFVVGAAYPNPFNPSAIVPFELTKDAMVQASVYDLVGREVKTLVNGNVSAGSHELKIDGKNMTTGIYLVKVVIDNTANIQKIALMK